MCVCCSFALFSATEHDLTWKSAIEIKSLLLLVCQHIASLTVTWTGLHCDTEQCGMAHCLPPPATTKQI